MKSNGTFLWDFSSAFYQVSLSSTFVLEAQRPARRGLRSADFSKTGETFRNRRRTLRRQGTENFLVVKKMRFGSQNYESFVEIEGKISRNWIHIELLRINFFGRTREMNLAGVSEDFGPHSGSVVLLRLPDFFFTKNFSGRIFFRSKARNFFLRGSEKFFGRISALDFG